MGTKIITLDELSPDGEPTIQIVRPQDSKLYHVKLASESLDYIKTVKPVDGKTIILVLAMTAGEHYGCNRNGDAWHENPVQAGPTFLGPETVLPKHYKTFETNGRIYQHHANKDPEKSIGEILKAFYNWAMHRVELLVSLDNNKAEDIVTRINNDEFPAVSMGCFTAGTLVTMGDGTHKPIESICVGDQVRTHLGNIKKVTQTHKRAYNGALYHIKPAVYPEITCTEEHPFLTIQREDVRRKDDHSNFRWDMTATPKTGWTHAKCLNDEHYLIEPIDREVATPDFVTRAFARLFGYYLAEGFIVRGRNKNPVAVELIVNKEDAVVNEIETLCKEYGTRNPPNIYPKANCEKALVIDIYDNELAELCLEHGGSYARKKQLSLSAMHWHPDMQREMLGAYANGDGCGTDKGELLLSTASTHLAWQWISILHRLNLLPSVCDVEHKAGSGYNTKNTFEWIIHIGKQWAQQLSAVCSKVKFAELRSPRNDRVILGDNIVTPTREITCEDVVGIDVYNLEVEGDESYVAGGMAVHNCRVKQDVCSCCGNQAPNRSAYCDHAKFHLGEYLPNGKRVFVWNPSPVFFDLSMVRRPADRVAFMMKKVAEPIEIVSSAELGEKYEEEQYKSSQLNKLSLIEKVIRGEVPLAKTDDEHLHGLENFEGLARKAAESMEPLPDETIRAMTAHKPADLLSTLTGMGIVLTTPEFMKLFVWKLDPTAKIPENVLRKAVEMQRGVFDLLSNNPGVLSAIDDTGFVNINENSVDPKIAEEFSSLLEKRSQVGSYMYRHFVPSALKPSGTRGLWDPIDITDPQTGKKYQTTRRARAKAEDQAVESRLGDLAGGGLLLGGAYKLYAHPKLRFLSPLAAIPGAVFGWRGALGYPSTKSDTGEPISLPRARMPWEPPWQALGARGGTEMVEKRSSIHEGSALITQLQDHLHTGAISIKLANMIDTEKLAVLDFDALAHTLGMLLCT